MSGLGTTRTNVHDHQYAEDAENNGIYNNCQNMLTNILAANETLVLVFEIVRYGRKKYITKLKHTQNITYPELRRMIETTKYMEVIKNIPTNKAVMCETSATTKPEVIAQLVNEMRVLIQEMKTVIEAITEKLSKTQTPELQQAKRDRQSQTGRAQRPSLLR